MDGETRRHVLVAFVVCLLLAAACTSDRAESPPTTSGSQGETASGEGCTTGDGSLEALPDDLAGPIPVDEDIEIGELDNGLTTYVRRNTAPGGRAWLGLVVAAGSAQETDDQSGVAHFLEHMLFNGTEHWPGNELFQTLERFGTQIGPDLNAFTDYDSTAYWVEVPTDDPENVELAIDVLRDWATGATLDPAEVESERGVVTEELRLRDLGVDGRLRQALEDLAFEGTPYEDRAPGGHQDSVSTMDHDRLADFYETWYQPDLMAVVAVGDLDAEDVSDDIAAAFDDVEAGTTPRPETVVEPWTEPRYGSVVDPETQLGTASLLFALDPAAGASGDDRRAEWLRILAFDLLANRLRDDLARGDLALTSASSSPESPVAGLALPSLDIEASAPDLRAGVRAALEEFERACRFGFGDAELERVVASHTASLDEAFASQDSKQDQQYAFEYADGFLEQDPLPDAETRHTLDLAILDSVTSDEIEAWFADTYGSVPPSVFATGPNETDVPTAEELDALAAEVRDGDLDDREAVEIDDDDLMERPDAAEIADLEELDDFRAERLVFDNGVQVVIQPSDIHEGHVDLGGTSPGGLSVLADEDVAAGQILGRVLDRSGVGDYDPVVLETILAEKDVTLDVSLGTTSEDLSGSAAVEDLESLLQLVHLTLTQPRVSEPAVRQTVDELLPLAQDPTQDPEAAGFAALLDARYGSEPRTAALPDPAALEAVKVEQLRTLATTQLGQTGDLVFVLAGDFDLEDTEELAAAYLGTLPATPGEPLVDRAPDPPPGVEHREVRAGSGDQGRLLLLYTALGPVDSTTEVQAEVLRTLASTRLREVIREELAATYSPTIQIQVSYEPEQGIEALVDIAADPDRLAEVATVAQRELGALAAGDFTADELDRATTSVTRDFELWTNPLLIAAHQFYARHPDADPRDFLNRSRAAERVSADDVAALASRLFAPDRFIQVDVLPA